MRNIDVLPNWVMTKAQPMQYDSESATGIEMVAKMYAKMQEIVEHYNEFANSVNTSIKEFEDLISNEYEELELGLRQEFKDFIDIINLKAKKMNNEIANKVESEIANVNVAPEVIEGRHSEKNGYVSLSIAGSEIYAKITEGKAVVLDVDFAGTIARCEYVGKFGSSYMFYAQVPYDDADYYSFDKYLLRVNADSSERIYYHTVQ